jgi:hypothetical protein
VDKNAIALDGQNKSAKALKKWQKALKLQRFSGLLRSSDTSQKIPEYPSYIE